MGLKFENTYITLPKEFFMKVEPVKSPAPKLLLFNEELASEMGLDIEYLKDNWRIFSGNEVIEGSETISQAYAGHQFGNFNMLGDGRAVLLGEIVTPEGDRFDIQLKGSGRTPFSRRGDGKATLGPMLREYIISEAMKALKIPTTRSLAVALTGEKIMRDGMLPGAVLTRIAASHIRVGTFQFASQWGELDDIKALANYTLKRHYPEVESGNSKYINLLRSVIKNQAETISKWQCIGFIHGVMNTDNITISGETIDYGPCAFMDKYDPMTVFSSIDREGRYAYSNQPYMGSWGLARFAETLIPLLHEDRDSATKIAQGCIEEYSGIFHGFWMRGMRGKLGLLKNEPQDERLIDELLDIMKRYEGDFTNTFRAITMKEFKEQEIFDSEDFTSWYEKYQERLKMEDISDEERSDIMMKNNPFIIPRNHLVEEVLSKAVHSGDYEPFNRFLEALKDPFNYNLDNDEYGKEPPKSDEVYRTFCGT